eukprot:453469-Alexandrium_andersonii.AAC.1
MIWPSLPTGKEGGWPFLLNSAPGAQECCSLGCHVHRLGPCNSRRETTKQEMRHLRCQCACEDCNQRRHRHPAREPSAHCRMAPTIRARN